MVEISTDQRLKILWYTALKLFGNLGSDQNRCTRAWTLHEAANRSGDSTKAIKVFFQIIKEPGTVQVGTMSSARLKFHAVSESQKEGRGQT
jgi:hypothetical protein